MNRLTVLWLAAAILSTAPVSQTAASEPASTPKQVRKALAWELPPNPCKKPKPPGNRKQIFDDQGVAREEWDVDYYVVKRYKRKEQRWEKCVDGYKADLKKDFATLKDSAQYGLTKPQAAIILGKMKSIQTILVSPEGLAPEV